MVVTGCKMHIAAQLFTFTTQHQNHLGVGLETDHAIDDMRAGFL